MPHKKARITYWVGDIEVLFAWLATAFVAGALPNLVGEKDPIPLAGFTIAAAVVALFLWRKNKKRSGIGVFIHLPARTDRSDASQAANTILKEMSRRHRDWFRSGPDIRSGNVAERAAWMLTTVEHRLSELERRDGQDPPVFLYLYARLEEAFHLGHEAAEFSRQQHDTPAPSSSQVSLELQVKTYSGTATRDSHIFTLDLSKVRSGDADPPTPSLECERRPLGEVEENPPQPRMALIVEASPSENGKVAFFDKAAAAASAGRLTNGYLATEDDRCQHALLVKIDGQDLVARLRDGTSESLVRELFEKVAITSNELFGANVPVRLFTNGPSILSFAAGALLPPGSRYVPFDPNAPRDQLQPETGTDASALIAIIDGDDVGTQTERHLLSGELDEAVGYSRAVTKSIDNLVFEITKVPTVQLISQGGDSAMFSVPPSALPDFKHTLQNFRYRSSFRVSCGYGNAVREAYLSLRLAKSSGKNITLGSIEKT